MLDLDSGSSHLNFYAKMNEVNEKKIVRFHELCMLLIKYDLHPYPDQPLFYQQKFIELLNVNFLNKILHYEALEKTKQRFVDCLREQFKAMQTYGRLNVFRSDYSDLVRRFGGLEGFGVIMDTIFDSLITDTGRGTNSLLKLCRNQVRINMQGMSDRQIESLKLPRQIKAILF